MKSIIGRSGEEAFFLGRNDDHVLAKEDWKIAESTVSQLIDFAKYMPATPNTNTSTITNSPNVEMNFALPNVTDPQSFLKEIQTNKKVQRALQDITVGQAMGKNSLNVKKYK